MHEKQAGQIKLSMKASTGVPGETQKRTKFQEKYNI